MRRLIGFMIVKPIFRKNGSVFILVSRNFFAISLIVINLCSLTVSGVDQNTNTTTDTSQDLDSWLHDQNGYDEIIANCLDKCAKEDQYYGQIQKVGCQSYKELCSKGCNKWKNSTLSTCQQVCFDDRWQSSLSTCDVACIAGCNEAVNRIINYLGQDKDFKTPLMLLNATADGTSLTLSWPIDQKRYMPQRLVLQWSYDGSPLKWRYSSNFRWVDNYTCVIGKLQPYTKYQFRVAMIVNTEHTNFVYSSQSEVMQTKPYGPPSLAPGLIKTVTLDDSKIAVFWKQGNLINGPLEGYKIKVKMVDSDDTYSSEMTADGSENYTILHHLESQRSYEIEISMINSFGKGPAATIVASTASFPAAILNPTFVVTGENLVTLLNISSDGSTAKELYKSDVPIRGFDILIEQETFFVSDESGYIYRINMHNEAERDAILSPKSFENYMPSQLSIDWLYSYLYILGEILDETSTWVLARSSLTGSGLHIILEDLKEKPLKLYADALNGYLFWITSESGIFRMDLNDSSWKLIFKKANLTTFTVDTGRFLLTTFSKTDKKFLQISYDGGISFNEDIEVSSEVVVDLVNSKFTPYWTEGKDIYSNTSVTALYDSCAILKIFHSSAQPKPEPNKPPRELQALLTVDKAALSWKKPGKGFFQGAGAWNDWNYELEVREGEDSITIRHIKSELFTVERLKSDTEYWFRVRAVISNGVEGTWTDWFKCKSWEFSEDRHLLWPTDRGLLRSNEAAGELETLVNGSINSATWINRSIFITKDFRLSKWDMSEETSFLGEPTAHEVTYDWKGKKLYFTDASKGVTIRANLDGTERELLPFLEAKHIQLDPENGYIYYCTGLRIKACLLNGKSCRTYHRTGLFSEEDLIGPALDLRTERVFWITQSDHDAFLFSSPMAHIPPTDEDLQMLPLEGFPITNWFSYSPGRLIWATNRTSLVFSNEKGENQALVSLDTETHGVTIVEPTQEQQDGYHIIPDAVDSSTIKVVGLWDNFDIIWEPVHTNAGYNITYSLKIGDKVFLDTSETSVHYARTNLAPYSPFRVWITSSSPWGNGPTTTAEIHSPTAAPSEPRRLRAFIHRIFHPFQGGQNISAIVRWDSPKVPNGPVVFYNISCQRGEDFGVAQTSTDLETIFWNLEENATYSFQVQAFTSGAGGALSEKIEITVNSEFQSVPRVLVATKDYIGYLDMDLNSTKILAMTNSSTRHLAVIREENLVIWINEDGQLMSYRDSNKSILSSLESEVQALTVDWIFRIVYWAQADQGGGSTIHSLDLNQFDEGLIRSRLLISNPTSIKDLVILPMSQSLIWLEWNGTLSGWNLRELGEMDINLGMNATFQKMYAGSFERNSESVILVDDHETICMFDLQKQTCEVARVGKDSQNLQLAWDNGFVYALKNSSIRAYDRPKLALEYMVNTAGIIEISSLSLQPYPERKCLLPDYEEEPLVETNLLVPQLINLTTNSLDLRFPKIFSPPECGVKIPGLKYTILVREEEKDQDMVRELHSFETQLNIAGLKAFTKYNLQVQISNYYANLLGIPKVPGPGIILSTAPGAPSVPRNVTVSAISPRDGLVEWMQPEALNNDKVWYEIHWKTEHPTSGVIYRHQKVIPENNEKWNSFLLPSLRPDHTYWVWIKAFSTDAAFNSSDFFQFDTFPEPEGLAFVDSTAYSLTLSWNSSANITSAFLLYSPLDKDDPVSTNITADSHARVIESLEPRTKYTFQLKLFYSNSLIPYVWPPDNRFTFETLSDRPSAPGQPLIEHIKGEVFKIFWEPSRNNGAPILEYSLEALQTSQVRRVRRSHYYALGDDQAVRNKTLARMGQLPWAEEIEPIQDKWIPYCNGTDTSCIITDLHTMRLLMFRGRARNALGWGPYSVDSEIIAEPFVLPRKREMLVFAIIAPITIVSTCVSMIILIRYVHGRLKHAKKLRYESRPSIWGLDVATLQQVARSRNFSQTSSVLYTGKPLTDGDIALLPQINRDQITMHKFLGSGAFGEVYEGMVTYSEDGVQDRVAIKTLRKGASEQEKTELLQEAHLMSHFKHENIVKLIGVCFDLDSICIIMELMEGGDLQTYLRQARPNLSKLGTLSLLDLIGMCLDVCTGCRYLEDLHFLHRDLACRNCLVSSVDPQYRVVKIGDFGLARDIYKSDYYRKEGEGLLPVRWMAPECLVDGVFTSQSDIWSFGVLLWEILSLGQQPYPAQSNLEVLNFVKEGGRLQQPQECPNRLYKLMMQCWSHEPEERPTFQRCLNELMSLKVEILNLKHAKDCEVGITNMSFEESGDGESVSKVSASSKSQSNLDCTFTEQLSPNQENETEGSGRELASFSHEATSIKSASNCNQPKRKSVHYVNEGWSKL